MWMDSLVSGVYAETHPGSPLLAIEIASEERYDGFAVSFVENIPDHYACLCSRAKKILEYT